MHFIFGFLFLITSLWAEPDSYSDTPDMAEQKVLYISYKEVPQQIFQGEVFAIRLKTLSTVTSFDNITYQFENAEGLTLLTPEPVREIKLPYYYDTFYFIADKARIRTPDITGTVKFSEFYQAYPTRLQGQRIDVVSLNPNRHYVHILADNFSILQAKTTYYDRHSNIAVFTASAERCNLETFKLTDVIKQGFESIETSFDTSTMTYYAVIPSEIETLKFSYFNLQKKRFVDVIIPIIIDDDSVSTQSDLKPIEHKHTLIKITAAGAVAFVGLILLLIYRRVFYLLLVIIPGLYIAYVSVPIQYACIKEGSPIYLLPMQHGTIFETTTSEYNLEVQGSVTSFIKVKLHNNNIGWIKNEDLCTP